MSYESARDHRGPLVLDCDVVVVGSGAGGSVVATELAESGQSVVVLEEGARVPQAEYGAMRVSESLRHIWRDGGMTVAAPVGDSPAINVTMGKVVGGSSVLTGGVCFRLPGRILKDWRDSHGLPEYTEASMEEPTRAVEKHTHVEEVPVAMRSKATTLFDRGARASGFQLESLKRNTKDCRGCGRCNFGCPEGAKLSVDLSYLPRAVKAGTTVFSHCLVTKVRTEYGRAVGVEGRILNGRGGKAGDRLVVHARRVVLACSAWYTPLILQASGIGKRSRSLGKRMTLHPGFRMMARFDEDVRGWRGAMQSAFSDAFEEAGVTLVSVFVPPSVVGATMPGIGLSHYRRAKALPNIAMFGGMIHDTGSGVVRRGPGREPIVSYRLAKEDRPKVYKIIRVLAETYFAAGAKEVFPPVLGLGKGLTPDEFRSLDLEQLPMRRFEVSSQHPMGTVRMGRDGHDAVVDADGRAFDVDELYVADGSIVPTSLGVNPQLSIMSIATRLAWRMRERRLR
ncbi:MAG: GMC family oxidoreductase [Myxococcota bacterium]